MQKMKVLALACRKVAREVITELPDFLGVSSRSRVRSRLVELKAVYLGVIHSAECLE